MGESKLSSVSRADSIEKMGEFWDQHDFTDFDDPAAPDVPSCARIRSRSSSNNRSNSRSEPTSLPLRRSGSFTTCTAEASARACSRRAISRHGRSSSRRCVRLPT